jgi:phosphatidylcholine synthase
MVKTNMLCEPVVVYGTMPLLASAFGFARVTAKLDDGTLALLFFSRYDSYCKWHYRRL